MSGGTSPMVVELKNGWISNSIIVRKPRKITWNVPSYSKKSSTASGVGGIDRHTTKKH